ncbi:MAG: glycosyltransferase family 4 protein [Deltaproteobacteria bacterium]
MPLRILVVTRNLPPLVGGMERLVWNMITALSMDFHVHVVGPKGCLGLLPRGICGREIPARPLSCFIAWAFFYSLAEALRHRPHVVLAGSGLTAPMAHLSARISHARTCAYLHGLDIENRHPVYNLFWKPFIRRADQVIVNSRFTKALALREGVMDAKLSILPPGVSLPDISDKKRIAQTFRDRYGLGQTPIMLFVGRITPRKGLTTFIERILPHVLNIVPEARLLVIGDNASEAVKKQVDEKARALGIVRRLGLEDRVLFLGKLDNPQLTAAYFASDVHVFPVQATPYDNEGFGMVALEAAAHGLPTVAFDAGGVSDAVMDGISGSLIPAGNFLEFEKAVVHFLLNRQDMAVRTACRQFAQDFEWSLFGRRLRELVHNTAGMETP